MNAFLNLFRKIILAIFKYDNNREENLIGNHFYKTGLDYYKQQETEKALKSFDKAIESGYRSAEIYELRGRCLDKFEFYYDSISDYNKSISLDSGKANVFYMRSLAKSFIKDFRGALEDIEEAIRKSKVDNEDNRYWNSYAKETGFDSATQKYEIDLERLRERLERSIRFKEYENDPSLEMKDILDQRKLLRKNIKRRNPL